MTVSDSPFSLSLRRALEEVARVEQELLQAGDLPTLERFADAGHGASLAQGLGFTLITDEEARVISALRWLPHSTSLIREYLEVVGAPRLSAVLHFAPERTPAAAGKPGRRSSVHPLPPRAGAAAGVGDRERREPRASAAGGAARTSQHEPTAQAS